MLGTVLKYIRACNDLAAKEVAQQAGIAATYLCDVESNRKNPSIETLSKLADVYDIEVSKILYLKEQEQKGINKKELLKEIIDYYLEKESLKTNNDPDYENFFISLGYTKKDYEPILKKERIIRSNHNLLKENIIKIYNWFLDNGYSKENVLKMTKETPEIYLLSIENIEQKNKDIMAMRFTKEDVIKMTSSFSSLYSINIEKIYAVAKELVFLGFDWKDMLHIIKIFPELISLDLQRINDRYEQLIDLGYSEEESLEMIKSFPQLISFKKETLENKFYFYETIGLKEVIDTYPKNLMQSVDLSYARYKFLEENGIKITMQNNKKLFLSNKQFESQYKITKEQLLNNYKQDKMLIKKGDNK